jgi:hypothetical protein
MEPDRELSMKILSTGEALYLCTNVLLGLPGGSHSAVTLWLDGGSLVRVRLTPDGKLEVAGGEGFSGPAPGGIDARFTSGDRLQAQEDLYPLEDPWWSAEVRIPWSALAPFQLGEPLRLAVAYDGEAATGAGIGLPEKMVERWPAVFDELRHADPALGAKAVVRAHGAAVLDVPVDDAGAFLDVDTPEDYARATGQALPGGG